MWRLENNVTKSVFSFKHVCSGAPTQGLRLGSKSLYPLSYFTGPEVPSSWGICVASKHLTQPHGRRTEATLTPVLSAVTQSWKWNGGGGRSRHRRQHWEGYVKCDQSGRPLAKSSPALGPRTRVTCADMTMQGRVNCLVPPPKQNSCPSPTF